MINSCAAILIAAKHGELTKIRDCSGITYTVGTLRCKFDFRTSDWDYTTRTAVFCKGNVATHSDIVDKAIGVLLDKDDECAVPPEVLLPDEKYFSVGVWGVTEEGLRIVSEWLVFRIKDGCYVNSSESIPPTPTVYEQIITELSSKAPISHDHKDIYYPKVYIDNAIKNIDIPTKVSELENDIGYMTEYLESDPTVPEWAKSKEKPIYTAAEVGADPKGSAANAIEDAKQYADEKMSIHEMNTVAHNDIRLKIQEVTNRLNAFLNTDDITLDQLSEIITYIKDNKTLIESVTTEKVNVSDIVDNLTTNVSNKPLSANQGIVLKSLIDAITIPSKVSQLSNDAGYISSVPDEYVTEAKIEELTDDILSKVKQSGEFDGKDGVDGLTPYIADNGNWWIGKTDTGVKAKGNDGVNGKDGINGTDGVGISNIETINNELIVTLTNGTIVNLGNIKGIDGINGKDGVDGNNGTDGISATHKWEGTALTITSASGTSSADLKGEQGNDGYTPVKGTDYWTDDDKAEIKNYVDEAILGGAW